MNTANKTIKKTAAFLILGAMIFTASHAPPSIASTSVPAASSTQGASKAKSLQTVGGALRVVPGSDDLGEALIIDKKPIKNIEGTFIQIEKSFRIGANDIVLVSVDQGGSCCPWSDWYFLTITPQGKTEVSADIQVFDAPKIQLIGSQITLTTVEQDGRKKKTKVWIFENGKVRQQQ